MMSAPAATAARMTSGLLVSTEMNTADSRAQRFDDRHDALELLVERRGRCAPGRVDSPPMSMMRGALVDHAPRVRAAPHRARANWPPSEKESGVTLSTPMTTGVARSRTRSRHCHAATVLMRDAAGARRLASRISAGRRASRWSRHLRLHLPGASAAALPTESSQSAGGFGALPSMMSLICVSSMVSYLTSASAMACSLSRLVSRISLARL